MYSKKEQTKKNKAQIDSKLTASVREHYKAWLHERQGGLCFCGCERPIDEYHHARFGIWKDDRTLIGIARDCHYAIHHGRDTERKRRLINLSQKLADVNWDDFSLSKL